MERTPEEIRVLQEIWAIILENGSVSYKDSTHSYYGGWQLTERLSYREIPEILKEVKSYRNKIREVGVDWAKMDVPEYKSYSEFAGTDSPSDTVEVWQGIITLMDGTQMIGHCEDRHTSEQINPRVSKLKKSPEPDPRALILKHFNL